jgi:hypothetical protein
MCTVRRSLWRMAQSLQTLLALLTVLCSLLCLPLLRSCFQNVGDGALTVDELVDMFANDDEVFRALYRPGNDGAAGLGSADTDRGYAPGESQEEVQCEFSEALAANGYSVKRSDATGAKYLKYMKHLFDVGTFTCRSDFFAPGAQKLALAACEKRAANTALDKTKRTTSDKLTTNYMHGFNKYVRFCAP